MLYSTHQHVSSTPLQVAIAVLLSTAMSACDVGDSNTSLTSYEDPTSANALWPEAKTVRECMLLCLDHLPTTHGDSWGTCPHACWSQVTSARDNQWLVMIQPDDDVRNSYWKFHPDGDERREFHFNLLEPGNPLPPTQNIDDGGELRLWEPDQARPETGSNFSAAQGLAPDAVLDYLARQGVIDSYTESQPSISFGADLLVTDLGTGEALSHDDVFEQLYAKLPFFERDAVYLGEPEVYIEELRSNLYFDEHLTMDECFASAIVQVTIPYAHVDEDQVYEAVFILEIRDPSGETKDN